MIDPTVTLRQIETGRHAGQFRAEAYAPAPVGAAKPFRHRHLLGTSDRKAAELALEEYRREVLPGQVGKYERTVAAPADPANPSCTEMIDAWKKWAQTNLRPRTVVNVCGSWKTFVALTKVERVREISRGSVEDFKQRARAVKRPNGKPVRAYTINNHVKNCRAVFNRMRLERFYAGDNPFDGVAKLKTSRPVVKFHSLEQLAALYAEAARRPPLDRLVLLCALAGMRKREAIYARWEWFDFDAEYPTIHIQPGHGLELKDHQARPVSMHPLIHALFRPAAQPDGFVLVSPRRSDGKAEYRYDPKNGLIAALKAAKLPTARPYQQLRQTFATLHLRSGSSIPDVSGWLGHAEWTTTQHFYAAVAKHSPSIANIRLEIPGLDAAWN